LTRLLNLVENQNLIVALFVPAIVLTHQIVMLDILVLLEEILLYLF